MRHAGDEIAAQDLSGLTRGPTATPVTSSRVYRTSTTGRDSSSVPARPNPWTDMVGDDTSIPTGYTGPLHSSSASCPVQQLERICHWGASSGVAPRARPTAAPSGCALLPSVKRLGARMGFPCDDHPTLQRDNRSTPGHGHRAARSRSGSRANSANAVSRRATLAGEIHNAVVGNRKPSGIRIDGGGGNPPARRPSRTARHDTDGNGTGDLFVTCARPSTTARRSRRGDDDVRTPRAHRERPATTN